MSVYNNEYNKDNVVLRYIIVSLLAELRDKVYYYDRISEDETIKHNVPFIYSISGNERFLQDNFVYDNLEEGKAIGDYEVVPRGMVQLDNLSIDSSSITNKFVRSELVKEIDGKLKTVTVDVAYLPINMTFNTTVICSNNLEMLKLTESVMSKLYKATLFQVDLGMFRVQASMQVPEDYAQERLFEFELNDKKEFNVTFPIEVKSFLPVLSGGILLSELYDAILTSDSKNQKVLINGKGIFEQFDTTIADINISPKPQITSNTVGSYINLNTVNPGEIFNQSVTDGIAPPIEPPYSEEYRNADDPRYDETQ
jgi:hypothetical protein